MTITIAAVGQLKPGAERDICDRYLSRIGAAGRALGLGPLIVRECSESRARRAPDRRLEEGRAILALAPQPARLILLDETGEDLTSQAFAQFLEKTRDQGQQLVFAIGGADGHSEEIRARASHSLSFGRATLPHQFARVILIEQIYRACTILAGHPYHRA